MGGLKSVLSAAGAGLLARPKKDVEQIGAGERSRACARTCKAWFSTASKRDTAKPEPSYS